MPGITISTDHYMAEESPDHLAPYGVLRDNSTDSKYIDAVKKYFVKQGALKVLDLGCAGGQLVSDFIYQGYIAVGLEGSPNVLTGAGADNWSKLHNQNLFLCDLTKDYQLYFDGWPAEFDFIQSWEVVEHIAPKDLPAFFEGVLKHLAPNGVFCCSIALYPSYGEVDGVQVDLHQSLFNPAEWVNILFDNGFELAVDPSWPPMPQSKVPANRKFEPSLGYDPDADEGIIKKDQGVFLGYLFGDAMFRNHDRHESSIYFCLRRRRGD
jgi:SAM-dependent methyltransferase